MRNLILAALLASCTQPRSKLCREVCAKEYECVTTTGAAMPFDEKECVAACSVLEVDRDNLAKVQKHADCVRSNQASCPAVLACQ